MYTVLGIGWDVGGWMGNKHGLAIAEWEYGNGSITWLGTATIALTEILTPQEIYRLVTGKVLDESSNKIVIGVDAPLGFPIDYQNLVSGYPLDFSKPQREIDNRLAYRETERYLHRVFSKKALSAPFDKLGNNATVAIYYAKRWAEYGYQLHPMADSQDSSKSIIEVYPALSKTKGGMVTSPILELLPLNLKVKTDEYDAAICALLAIAYGANGTHPKLPILVGPPKKLADYARQEGWIYHLPIESE